VRYEDLLEHPERELARICQGVGVRLEPEMLQFHERNELMLRDQPWKENVLRPLGAVERDHSRRGLDPGQIAIIEWLAGRTTRELDNVPEFATTRRSLLALRALPRALRASWAFKREQDTELSGPLARELSATVTRSLYRLLFSRIFNA
jgi:hypothetical protein